jgi:mannose-6-phosphate isomerase-like protein (cupin superfamily)
MAYAHCCWSFSAGYLLATILGTATVMHEAKAQTTRAAVSVKPSTPDNNLTNNSLAKRSELRQFEPRLVVTGLDNHGKSTFVYDGSMKSAQRLPTSTSVTMWQVAKIPGSMKAGSNETELSRFMPPPEGFRAVMVELLPDSVIGDEAAQRRAFAKVLEDVGETGAARTAGPPGMHQTESCELVTVISGQLYAVLESGEKLLRPGDTLIQRGTSHAWSNRSKNPVVVLYVVWPAER